MVTKSLSVTDIAKEAGISPVYSGDIALIRTSDSERFFDQCLARGVIIGRIEGIWEEHNGFRQDLDRIIEFEEFFLKPDGSSLSISEARTIVNSWIDPRLLLDFIFAEV